MTCDRGLQPPLSGRHWAGHLRDTNIFNSCNRSPSTDRVVPLESNTDFHSYVLPRHRWNWSATEEEERHGFLQTSDIKYLRSIARRCQRVVGLTQFCFCPRLIPPSWHYTQVPGNIPRVKIHVWPSAWKPSNTPLNLLPVFKSLINFRFLSSLRCH